MNESFWSLLDEPSRYRILVSGHGKHHLLNTAERLFLLAGKSKEKRQLLAIGADMVLAAWEDSPLDGQLAANLLRINRRMNFLPSSYCELMEFVVTNYCPPKNTRYFESIALERDNEQVLAYLNDQLKKDPENLFWLGHFLDISLFSGNPTGLDSLASLEWPDFMSRIVNKYKGDFLFCAGDTDGSIDVWYDAIESNLLGQTSLKLAHALNKSGKIEEAHSILEERMKSRPWQINTCLCAYEMIFNEKLNNKKMDGFVSLCLYTYNKASDLAYTFEALALSALENVNVFVLNNGCTDETSSVLSSWKDRLGDKLKILDMPINIGAPAARNWLKRQSGVLQSDYVAYLDDDAVIPQDWQISISNAVKAYPDAAVWGCRVVENGREEIIQHADIHLREPDKKLNSPLRGFNFSYFDSFNQNMDYGQYKYCRPCTSVTGCFHVFRREVLEASDDFDLRYSPSQYDDLDHDLSLAVAGLGPAVYQGALKVHHKRLTGTSLKHDRASRGAAAGNVMKLEAKYSYSQVRSIIKKDMRRLEADYMDKASKLTCFFNEKG